MSEPKREEIFDFQRAAQLLEAHWQAVVQEAGTSADLNYVAETSLRSAFQACVNHGFVSYRFCLPVQLLGKLTHPALDCLRLQKGGDAISDVTGWDARSLASKVVAPFNQREEHILGSSSDPYVGNPMRVRRMTRDDASKKDVAGGNVLVDVLEAVEHRADATFTAAVFRQVLLELFHRQQSLRFTYVLPPRISLEDTLALATEFLKDKSGGDRALALAGALFDAIGIHFGLFARVNRARINASDEAIGQAADLECIDARGQIALAVEVKDRLLTLADIDGTLQKSRRREIRDVFFTSPGVLQVDQEQVAERFARAFSSGQNLYHFQFLELARGVLALGGEAVRSTFLRKVGEHLDTWNTQPRHRQAWKRLLEAL